MKAISNTELAAFLVEAQIHRADPNLRIGRQLTYAADPLRVVVVHFGESESPEYIEGIFRNVLAIDESWFITPRYGSVSDFGIAEVQHDAAAILAVRVDAERLITFLYNRFEALQTMEGNDLYLVAGTGQILVTYDHHSPDEGLAIHLNDIAKTSQLLVILNEMGAEMELFSTSG